MTISKNNSFKEAIEYHLPFFDDILAKKQEVLSRRPLAASCFFVEHCVVDVKGGLRNNFLEENWFKQIYKITKQWYVDRYADALTVTDDYKYALGLILIYGTPFQLNIPLSIAQDWVGVDKRWFCLPNEILEDENVLEWIEKKPDFDRMSKKDLEGLKASICKIATCRRLINVDLMMASLNKKLHNLADTIPSHIDSALQDILSMRNGRIANSYWEIHMAVEKAIKLIILQYGRDHQNSHNLNKLCKIAQNIKGIQLDCNVFSKLPSDRESIKQRYAEGICPTVEEAVKNYSLAIGIISQLSNLLKRKVYANNARVLISIGPWEK